MYHGYEVITNGDVSYIITFALQQEIQGAAICDHATVVAIENLTLQKESKELEVRINSSISIHYKVGDILDEVVVFAKKEHAVGYAKKQTQKTFLF